MCDLVLLSHNKGKLDRTGFEPASPECKVRATCQLVYLPNKTLLLVRSRRRYWSSAKKLTNNVASILVAMVMAGQAAADGDKLRV